ncbi:MAG: hypothetical protein OES09_14220, partial [Gammaproteobacteria bacterium]|nr:hypothetical protein [Gammaproteobacteria bacterium]
MKIDFHVPTGHTHTPGPDPDLRVIQAAISSGGTDLLERVTELRDAVYLLRHCTQIAPATVLETLAEVDGVVVSQVEEQFQKRRVGLSLPLTNTEQDLCAGMNSLYGQIAKAYSSLIPDRCSELSNDELLVIPEAAYGTLHYLYELLLCAYQAYQNVPNNTWRQIHALYRRACALGIEDEPIAGPQTAHATVKFLYQHTLLIGLSNPYHFAFRAIRLIDDYVGTHVTQTKLTHSVSRSTNECLFVVDPRIDYPAIPMLSRVRSGNTSECLILDTFEISVDLHHKIKALCGASERPSDRSLAGFSEAERLETLKALLTQWGFHPIRSLARRQSSGKCELAVGLGAVSFVLNGSEPVSMFDEQTEAYAADNVIKGSFGQQQFTQRTQFSLSGGWTLVDESKQGARLL